ncbi:MAG: hypothetical protein ACE5OZ_26100 [Candidatus Heimdallarchaeota archaeon]
MTPSEIGSLYELKSWLRRKKFHQLRWTGETRECDLQYYRQIGKGRYHLRIYDHPDRLVIESHFDRRDPLEEASLSLEVLSILVDLATNS